MKNQVSLIGHLGQDPELKTFDNGKQVCNFTLATKETWLDDQGNRTEETMWHNIVIWGKSGKLASEWLKKGHKLALDGRIKYREYTNKEGVKMRVTDIVCDEFFPIHPKPTE